MFQDTTNPFVAVVEGMQGVECGMENGDPGDALVRFHIGD